MVTKENRAIVVGWFSYEQSDSTAGDWLAADLVGLWLDAANLPWDLAVAAPFRGGVDLEAVHPADYSHAIFVCGPFMRNSWEADFLGRFADCCVVGVNLSLPIPLHVWHPFDLLFERDSNCCARPDITFGARSSPVPVVGVCLVEPYDEALVDLANAAVARLVGSREMAVVTIDTRLDINSTNLRTKAEVESLLARMDAVITTRLHGTVLSLKNGVPVLALDPEPGGGKVLRQAEVLGWPAVFTVDSVDDEKMRQALEYCLSQEARAKAKECGERGRTAVVAIRDEFVRRVKSARPTSGKRTARLVFAMNHGWKPRD